MANSILTEWTTRHAIRQGEPAPTEWRAWLQALFPAHVRHPHADRHAEFWAWCWAMETEDSPRPFVGIWPRGGGKSTTAELGTAALGLRGCRKYALYVRETQEQADKSVGNIAALLEAQIVAKHYPAHADRAVSKFGSSLGWRRNRLRTNGGFTVDAIGLDTAARGVKVEEQRPDLIIFDDIDGKLDSSGTTAKKIATITTSLLPAGSSNVAVMAIQNLIIPDGVFSQLADGRADFLAERIVSGPFPAVADLVTEMVDDPETGTRRAMIVGGTATWAGQNLATCQTSINLFGLASFEAECQHDVSARREGLALKFTTEHYADLTDDEARELVKLGRVFGGLDFGAWRFACLIWAVDRAGVPHCIVEYFSQREELSVRARAIHDRCEAVGIKRLVIWGDAANPTDIMELNAAFRRMGSPLRVVAVAMENKVRAASVTRLNDLLGSFAIRFRRTLGAGTSWRLGYSAASKGTPIEGSRLVWEMKHWAYPIPQEGQAQSQDPDDNTADGGDAIAAMRYAIMSWWKAAKAEAPPEVDPFDASVMARAGRMTLREMKDKAKQKGKHKVSPIYSV